jgi:hypothetical protein
MSEEKNSGCEVCWDWEKNWKNVLRIVGKVVERPDERDRIEVRRKMGRDTVGSEGRKAEGSCWKGYGSTDLRLDISTVQRNQNLTSRSINPCSEGKMPL